MRNKWSNTDEKHHEYNDKFESCFTERDKLSIIQLPMWNWFLSQAGKIET